MQNSNFDTCFLVSHVKEEHRLMVCQRVQRKVFGPQRRIKGRAGTSQGAELHNSGRVADISPYLRLTYTVDLYVCSAWRVRCTMIHGVHSAATHHRTRHAGFWWGEIKKGNTLEDLERGQLDNIAMELQQVGWGDMDWIALAQDRDTWRALDERGNELSGSIKCGEFLEKLRTCELLRNNSAPRS
jgi:hypothetical protein